MRAHSTSTLSTTLTVAATIAASFLAACSPQSNGVAANGTGIVNGSEAVKSDLTGDGLGASVVFIETKVGKGVAMCTGTVILPNVILTAAHCAPRGTAAADMIVVSGLQSFETAKTTPILKRTVQAIVQNPGYQPDPKNDDDTKSVDDIALLLLSQPFPDSVKSAQLPTNETITATPTTLMSVGYGQADDRHNTMQDSKGVGTLRYTTFERFAIAKQGSIAGMIIADTSKTSVCHGDSGGPLMNVVGGKSTNVILGVAEAVSPRFQGQQGDDFNAALSSPDREAALKAFYAKYPDAHDCVGGTSVFVEVSSHLQWIAENANALVDQAEKAAQSPAPVASK